MESEALLNVVNRNKPKVLRGLHQRVRGRSRTSLLSWRRHEDHRRTGETYVIHMVRKRNVETPYLSRRSGRNIARGSKGGAGTGRWKKRRLSCNGADRGCAARQHHPTRKRAHVHRVVHHENRWSTDSGDKADVGGQEFSRSPAGAVPRSQARQPQRSIVKGRTTSLSGFRKEP